MVVRRCMNTNGGDGSEGPEGRGFHMVVWVSWRFRCEQSPLPWC